MSGKPINIRSCYNLRQFIIKENQELFKNANILLNAGDKEKYMDIMNEYLVNVAIINNITNTINNYEDKMKIRNMSFIYHNKITNRS
jgi:hypothetical protein